MIGIEFFPGSGLGNQLFYYVTARAVALYKNTNFGVINSKYLANNIHCDSGMYFLDIDLGEQIEEERKEDFCVFTEKEERIYLANSRHDVINGVYVSGADHSIFDIDSNTLLYGNLQDESYFFQYKNLIKEWLKVKEQYDTFEYSRDNLCVIHIRCGDYIESPELWLRKQYWQDGIANMKKIREDMEFVIVTDDIDKVKMILPGINAISNDIGTDYAILKNAKYLLLSNSSFAVMPAFSSEVLRKAIAPKYWARHNVSNGYWSSEQNIYSIFTYQDRKGRLFSAEECRRELEIYKKSSFIYKFCNIKPNGLILAVQGLLWRIKRKILLRVNY